MNWDKFNTTIRLTGNPVFSLTYIDRNGNEKATDINGYRPDPRDFLKPQTTYNAKISSSVETIGTHEVENVRQISVGGRKFGYVL